MIKYILNYEGLYSIDEYGVIYSHKTESKNECILTPFLVSGYKTIKLSKGERINKKQFQVHRLVAQAFIPNPENKPFVNHIDSNKLNNHISNLEWVNGRENATHAINKTKKSSKYTGVSWNKERQKWSGNVQYNNKKYIHFFSSEDEAAIFVLNKTKELKIINKYANTIKIGGDSVFFREF